MEENLPTRHVPVLLDEVMRLADPQLGETAVDATFGGGGYAHALLSRVGSNGRVIGLDTDQQALKKFEESVELFPPNLILQHANFSQLASVLDRLAITSVDRIVADLGFSSDQIEDPKRGLSLMQDGPLDMRLDASQGETAKDILSSFSEDALQSMLTRLGDEPEAKRLARAIVDKRSEEALQTTAQLRELIEEVYPKRLRARMKIHPATRTFQALRIAVNREDEHLEAFLQSAVGALRTGGRLAVVAFHSGEDRVVKHFFRREERPCICPSNLPQCACGKKPAIKIITKKPVMPNESEVAENPRSRSAVLRVAEKV